MTAAYSRWRATAPLHAAVLALFGFVSLSIVYVSISQFDIYDSATGGTTGDSSIYARMARGAVLEEIPKPYRYRIGIPALARLLPHDTDFQVQVAYGLVNLVALTLTGWVLYLLLRRWFDPVWALVGAATFYASWVVVRFAGAVLVDAPGYLLLVACVYAIVTRRNVLLLLVFTAGMLVKETTALAVLVVFLMGSDRTVLGRQVAACATGLLGYAVFRFLLYPADAGYTYTAGRAGDAVAALFTPSGAADAVSQFVLTFGPLWVLAVLGWRAASGSAFPRRLAAIVPVCLIVPFVIGSNFGRVWFLAFPAVIPLAVLGLQGLVVCATETSAAVHDQATSARE